MVKKHNLDHLKEHQWKKGQSGNPGGRPKGGLKDYDRQKFLNMTDKEKDIFLNKLSPELRYRMAEGNPANELTGKGGKDLIPAIDQSKLSEDAVKQFLGNGKDIKNIE